MSIQDIVIHDLYRTIVTYDKCISVSLLALLTTHLPCLNCRITSRYRTTLKRHAHLSAVSLKNGVYSRLFVKVKDWSKIGPLCTPGRRVDRR